MSAQDQKTARAVAFIESLRDMGSEHLQTLIREEAGEGLSAFFASYAGRILEAQKDEPSTASTLMMLGYLIRANEETGEDQPAQEPG